MSGVVLGELCLNSLIHVAVDPVGAECRHKPVGVEDVQNLRLDAGEAERDPVGLGDLVELRQFCAALRVDEVDAFEVENERVQSRLAVPDECADTVVERLGCGKEETAVEAQTAKPGKVSSPGNHSKTGSTRRRPRGDRSALMSSGQRRAFDGAGRRRVGEASHAEGVEQAEEAGEERYKQRHL